jgi:hypothetical protein
VSQRYHFTTVLGGIALMPSSTFPLGERSLYVESGNASWLRIRSFFKLNLDFMSAEYCDGASHSELYISHGV